MSGSGWIRVSAIISCLLAIAGCKMLGPNAWPEPTHDALVEKLAVDSWQPDRDHSVLNLAGTISRQDSKDHAPFRWVYRVRPPAETDAGKTAKTSTNAKSPKRKPKPEPWTIPAPSPKEKQELASESQTSDDSNSGDADNSASTSTARPASESQPTEAFWGEIDSLSVTAFLNAVDSRAREHASNGAQTPPVSQSVLQELATRNDLVGWNAAIHLGRRFPEAAAGIAPILKWLATEQPAYDASNGKFVDNGQAALPPSGFRSPNGFATLQRWVEKQKTPSNTQPAPAESSHVSVAMQAAAIEAWCLVLSKTNPDIRIALTTAGRLLQETYLLTHVRAELFRSLAWWLPPDEIPYLARALEETDDKPQAPTEVRRAAIDACLIHAVTRRVRPSVSGKFVGGHSQQSFDASFWPSTADHCRWDADPHVRRSFGRWLGLSRHPRGFPLLTDQLADTDPRVRENALISLGYLGTPEARGELIRQAEIPQERTRAFAIRGLSHFGPEILTPYLSDTSYVVRGAVAEELGKTPSSATALRMQSLLTDRSLPVQLSAVSAIDAWPNPLAVPLLLHGMRESSRSTRKKCFDRLRKRKTLSASYRYDASRNERNAMIDRLVADGDLPTALLDGLRKAGLHRESSTESSLHARELEEQLRQLSAAPGNSALAAQLIEQLRQSDPADAAIIERFLEKHPSGTFRAIVLSKVLPELSQIHRSLKMLSESDVRKRRRAAATIARESEKLSLSSTTLRELRPLLVHEQDRLVWQYVMKAVTRDATDEGAQLALLAISSTWPDIRRLGCQYVLLHPRQEYALWLIPLFHDDRRDVQYLAVEAAGKCRNPNVLKTPLQSGRPSETGGLRSLLSSSDRELRFRTAIALTLLGDAAGEEELLRMSYERSARIRSQAFRAMAETGRTRFRDHLIRTAHTEGNDAVRRTILESLETLTPRDEHPVDLHQAKSDLARVEQWVAWRQKRLTSASRSTIGRPRPAS